MALSIDLTPMDTPHSVPVRFRFTKEQYKKLEKGIAPDIDTRWFVLFEDNIIHCYRTWTGYEVFRAELKPDSENFVITELLVESNKEKYNSDSEERQINSFAKIIAWFVLLVSEDDIRESPTWLTSVNYKEAGPFNLEELTIRAKNRSFTWDMYVYRFPTDDMWRPVRDIPELKQILLKHFPLQAMDTGPAGGYVIENSSSKRLVEVSPYDAGFCAWEDALNICKNFTCNGFGNWRLPSVDELKRCDGLVSHQLRVRKSIKETDEVILHWSDSREGETAAAVVTCEIKDEYVPAYILSYMSGVSGGYWKSKNGPWCGNEIKCPVTDWRSVRPVRDLC